MPLNKEIPQDYIKAEQLKRHASYLPQVVSKLFLSSTLVAVCLLFAYDFLPVLFWYGYMCIAGALRFSAYKFLNKEGYERRGVQFWLNVFVVFAALSGLGVGLMVFFFLDLSNFVLSIFVFLAFTTYLSAGVQTTSYYMPLFYAFSGVSLICLLIVLVSEWSSVYLMLIAIVSVYYLSLHSFARSGNASFMENALWNKQKDQIVDELRYQKEKAEKAVQAKSTFLASASHDLRQPLHAMGLFHDALRYRLKDPEDLKIMDKILASSNALDGLLHSLLNVSKLEASAVENNPEHFDISSLLLSICAEFNIEAVRKNIELKRDLPSELFVFADPSLIERVFRNLIDNAIHYTKKGSVTVHVVKVGSEVVVSVNDTGIGIPEDQLDNVFVEFQQLNNPGRDRNKGLGLGLSIVTRLCGLMNLEVDLKSTEGVGTNISIALPEGESVCQTIEQSIEDISFVGMTVLFIEDDHAVLEAMPLILENFGFQVSIATSGAQAMKTSSKVRPDIIIADLRLPGDENGLELIDAIRAYHLEYIPAILVTGDTDPEKIKMTESADVAVLHKPVGSDMLQEAINKILA